MNHLLHSRRDVFGPAALVGALQELLATLPRPAPGLCVALSGGLDSSVLLAALAGVRHESSLPALRAAHVDHGLQADSARWSHRCAATAESLGIPCTQLRVDARPPRGASPEAWARRLRLEALASQLGVNEVLLTAHHADDQFETVLLQLLRGGGAAGVAAMPRIARLGPGWQARPLLGYTRAALERWAHAADLSWLEDPSNRDLRFDRNYLRSEVLPALRARWPGAARSVGQSAQFLAEAVELAAILARTDLAALREGNTLPIVSLDKLPEPRLRAVLRAWIASRGLPLPSPRTLGALRRDLWLAADDRVPCARWQQARVYRYRGRLHADLAAPPVQELARAFELTAGRSSGGGLPLELHPAVGRGLGLERLPGPLELRPRRGGEQFRPAGSAHRRPLRKWLQERGVLPWLRDRVPLLYAGELLVAVGDLGCDAGYAAREGEASLEVRWPGRPVLTELEALVANCD